jgi:hypothetical protein
MDAKSINYNRNRHLTRGHRLPRSGFVKKSDTPEQSWIRLRRSERWVVGEFMAENLFNPCIGFFISMSAR